MRGSKYISLSLFAFAMAVLLLAFQNCGRIGTSIQESGSPLQTGANSYTASVAGPRSFPEGFGAALQRPTYNPHGPIANVLRHGTDDAIGMGIKTFKIHLSRATIADNSTFYRISDPRIGTVNSLVELARLPEVHYVLSAPFKTIFIDADNISLDGRTPIPHKPGDANNYWEFDNHRMQANDREAVFRETYEFTRYLLSTFNGTDRVFIIQNHEGDSHTTPDNHPHGVPTDIGLANFRDYWNARQSAIEKARQEVGSSARVYHMCEIVKVAKYLENPAHPTEGKSLLRDVLPHVTCDLIGYSAHDTAIRGDGGVMLYEAIRRIRQVARPSPTFHANNLVISEIAVPETVSGGHYIGQTEGQAGLIRQLLEQGMPWVVYWQLYDNDGVGNYLRRPDGTLSRMHAALVREFTGNSFPTTQRPAYVNQDRSTVVDPTPDPVDPDPVDPTPDPVAMTCSDQRLINPTGSLPSGVHTDIKTMYDEVLGGIGDYLAGARHMTSLYSQGYILSSLRRDLVRESVLRIKVNHLYQTYLRRDIVTADFENVKTFLTVGGTIRELELQIIASPECRAR